MSESLSQRPITRLQTWNADCPIAVVATAGIYPRASALPMLWQNLMARVDAAAVPTAQQWLVNPASLTDLKGGPDRITHARTCLLEPLDRHRDPVSAARYDLDALDPLYRLLIQVGHEAYQGARMDAVRPERIGVILANIALPTEGASAWTRHTRLPGLVQRLRAQLPELLAAESGRGLTAQGLESLRREFATVFDTLEREARQPVAPQNRHAMALPVAMLAESLGITGGSYALDAACASSLYALYLSCLELQMHRLDAVLTGGASMAQSLYTQVGFTQLQALSRSGVCRPFDVRADGLIVGQGAGLFALKRLRDAETAGDTIHGVIRGLGLSNDVAGSLLSPASEGQLRAMRQAYQSAGWTPDSVQYIECHGTGTPRGDSVELQSLQTLMQDGSGRQNPVVLGSIKANIGHLLTGAGAAALSKVLLSLQHKTLPPQANFSTDSRANELRGSGMTVLERPESWERPAAGLRRAAVSGFGFGGINAHLLLEEYDGPSPAGSVLRMSLPPPDAQPSAIEVPLAIVGMGARIGNWQSLHDLKAALLQGQSAFEPASASRLDDAAQWTPGQDIAGVASDTLLKLPGAFTTAIDLPMGRHKVPPGEIPSLLPQQALMLEAAADAIDDATVTCPPARMGIVMGIQLDADSTQFHLRWLLRSRLWQSLERLSPELLHSQAFMESTEALFRGLEDTSGAPLDAARTVGALGGMVASRVAREVRCGGPSFGVSNEDGSGLRALAVAARLLQHGVLDAALVGGVELNGHLQSLAGNALEKRWSESHRVVPFDSRADGCLPGDGATALVVKRLADAVQDGNRIYAVIRGIGNSGAFGPEPVARLKDAASAAWTEAQRESHRAGLVEAHGSGRPREDQAELDGLFDHFGTLNAPTALSSVRSVMGDAGSATGLTSVLRASLALYHRILPPIRGFEQLRSPRPLGTSSTTHSRLHLHVPIQPQHWLQDRIAGPRLAAAQGIALDGNVFHVVLEESFSAPTVAPEIDSEMSRECSPLHGLSPVIERSGDSNTLEAPIPRAVEYHSPRCYPLRDDTVGLLCVKGKTLPELRAQVESLIQLVETQQSPVGMLASQWHRMYASSSSNGQIPNHQLSQEMTFQRALVADSRDDLLRQLQSLARELNREEHELQATESARLQNGRLAFVFPGSGNHFPGMGRELMMAFPEVPFAEDEETQTLASQLLPRLVAPFRLRWQRGWEREAAAELNRDPQSLIFAQVCYGVLFSDLLQRFGLRPTAWLGYSLGESAALFSSRLWTARDEMHHRTMASPLFSSRLAGACEVAKQVWQKPDAVWAVAVVNRPKTLVLGAIQQLSQPTTAALLIANAPDECVVGGDRPDVRALIGRLGCEALYLDGVPTVHCDVMAPEAEAYHALHVLPTHRLLAGAHAEQSPVMPAHATDTMPSSAIDSQGLRHAFYSGAWASAYEPTSKRAADSILANARHGFDFTQVIEQAYADGIRIFVEPGPQGSCTRMIRRILQGKPHLAVAMCQRDLKAGQGTPMALRVLLTGLAKLINAGVPVQLDALYEDASERPSPADSQPAHNEKGRKAGAVNGTLDSAVTGKRIVRLMVGASSRERTLVMKQETSSAVSAAVATRAETLLTDAHKAPGSSAQLEVRQKAPIADAESAWPIPLVLHPGRLSVTTDRVISVATVEPSRAQTAEAITALISPLPPTVAQTASVSSPNTSLNTSSIPSPRMAESRTASDPSAVPLNAPAHWLAAGTENMQVSPMNSILDPSVTATLRGMQAAAHASAQAQWQFLQLQQQSIQAQLTALTRQQQLLLALLSEQPSLNGWETLREPAVPTPPPFMDREQCLTFAVGALSQVLGPMFESVDHFPTRVRLPAEPLMLVDRILQVEGELGSPSGLPGGGRVVTEHDVLPAAWYLDGGRAPVCISVEAGQADLFLSGYLGIDLLTRGERVYRLLDARVVFHRDLPQVGDTIRYDIHIDRFIRQGDTWLFFFHFEGYIGESHLISMQDGCAGFFGPAQLEQGKGIVSLPEPQVRDRLRTPQGDPSGEFKPLLPIHEQSLTDVQVDALREGNLEVAFGPAFRGLILAEALRLPTNRMRLVHRIVSLEPAGGRYGLGAITGEADVTPDAWYLTCHFIDDPVMPGTLMYECCLHTLRVLLLRMGWVMPQQTVEAAVQQGDAPDLHYAPVPGVGSQLKCRGQVIPSTRSVQYRIELKEIGYGPEPYVIADALMYADGKAVVWMADMSCRLTGLDQTSLEALWQAQRARTAQMLELVQGSAGAADVGAASLQSTADVPYPYERILDFAIGNPSDAFGEPYRVFDQSRRIARLPGPPFCFISRIVDAGPAPWHLVPGGYAVAEYDVPRDAWYFAANRQAVMPFAVILEIALQPCGWLAAYLGSALRSSSDLHFRNLEGEAILHRVIGPDIGTLTVSVSLTDFSEAGGMIIQRYELTVREGAGPLGAIVYQGWTRFGFFPTASLRHQVGIRGARERMYVPSQPGISYPLPTLEPINPEEAAGQARAWLSTPEATVPSVWRGPQRPGRVLRMSNRVSAWWPEGGPAGLGYIAGELTVDRDAWFFAAHFYQDPVIPGSLGLEAFLQLLKEVCLNHFGNKLPEHGQWEPIVIGRTHRWFYRGQIIPTDHTVTVEAVVTGIEPGPNRFIVTADGFLHVDGRIIYEMRDFAMAYTVHR